MDDKLISLTFMSPPWLKMPEDRKSKRAVHTPKGGGGGRWGEEEERIAG